MLKLGGGGGWGPLQGGGGGSRGVVGRGGERDGGDSGSNFALTTGANPLVLAAPPPPIQELAAVPRGLWEWTLGSSWGESNCLTTPAREGPAQAVWGRQGLGSPLAPWHGRKSAGPINLHVTKQPRISPARKSGISPQLSTRALGSNPGWAALWLCKP